MFCDAFVIAYTCLRWLLAINALCCSRPTSLHDRGRDSDDDDFRDRDYDVAALANNLSQAFRYGMYSNDDIEEVIVWTCSSLSFGSMLEFTYLRKWALMSYALITFTDIVLSSIMEHVSNVSMFAYCRHK